MTSQAPAFSSSWAGFYNTSRRLAPPKRATILHPLNVKSSSLPRHPLPPPLVDDHPLSDSQIPFSTPRQRKPFLLRRIFKKSVDAQWVQKEKREGWSWVSFEVKTWSFWTGFEKKALVVLWVCAILASINSIPPPAAPEPTKRGLHYWLRPPDSCQYNQCTYWYIVNT